MTMLWFTYLHMHPVTHAHVHIRHPSIHTHTQSKTCSAFANKASRVFVVTTGSVCLYVFVSLHCTMWSCSAASSIVTWCCIDSLACAVLQCTAKYRPVHISMHVSVIHLWNRSILTMSSLLQSLQWVVTLLKYLQLRINTLPNVPVLHALLW